MAWLYMRICPKLSTLLITTRVSLITGACFYLVNKYLTFSLNANLKTFIPVAVNFYNLIKKTNEIPKRRKKAPRFNFVPVFSIIMLK